MNKPSNQSLRKLILVNTVFAIAMGFLESAVVVYLREIAYQGLPLFPLQSIPGHIALTEFLREVATVVMLLGVSLLSSKNGRQTFAFFIYNFAVWDIFYYIFLKFLIHWPESLLDWDVLFLIPVIWTGPVLAPVINSLCMITLANIILFFEFNFGRCNINKTAWWLLILSAIGIFGVYIAEYLRYALQQTAIVDLFSRGRFLYLIEHSADFVPVHFNWIWFCVFVFIQFIAFYLIIKKNTKTL